MARTGGGERKESHNTVYFRKHSRRLSLKCYVKADEKGALAYYGAEGSVDVERVADLFTWAEDKLRIEAVVRTMELKDRGLDRGSAWSDTTADELYASAVEKLELPVMLELPTETLLALPGRLRCVYETWLAGKDMRTMFSRSAFYRFRKELLAHGIDIASTRPTAPKSNVIPLIRRVTLVPAPIPDWAIGTRLYFDPRTRIAGR